MKPPKGKLIVKILAVSFTLIILMFCLGLVSLMASSGSFSEPSERVTGFPQQLADKETVWQIFSNKTEGNLSTTFWTDKGLPGYKSAGTIGRLIYTYSNPIEAKIAYEQKIFTTNNSNKWPNFYNPESRYLKDDRQFKLLEDTFVACEMGGIDNCQRWQYIGRSGKYMLEVLFITTSKGIDQESFFTIVGGIVSDLQR